MPISMWIIYITWVLASQLKIHLLLKFLTAVTKTWTHQNRAEPSRNRPEPSRNRPEPSRNRPEPSRNRPGTKQEPIRNLFSLTFISNASCDFVVIWGRHSHVIQNKIMKINWNWKKMFLIHWTLFYTLDYLRISLKYFYKQNINIQL